MLFGLVIGLAFVPLLAVVQIDAAMFKRHTDLIFEALRLADLTKEKACLFMAIDKNQFRRQSEEQEGHISLTRMMALPSLFWQWYALLLAEEFGVPKCVTRGMRLLMAMRNRRQLRMGVQPISSERRMA